ncbi:MAG: histidine phosphatase family protein [Microthrixaceae bacterium]
MPVIRYVTHPDVVVDPQVAIERWGLRPSGLDRARAMLHQPWVAGVERIVSSDETKARQTAEVLAARLDLPVEVRQDTGENDRSATGFLPPEEFERTADAFFARPDDSVRGWERATDAQHRIVAALADLLDAPSSGSTVVVGHGGVGTLWCCHLLGVPISRELDQPGQGHYITVDVARRAVLHPWRAIDDIESASAGTVV